MNKQGKKILIVEDEQSLLEALKVVLKKEGFRLDEALNGEEGFARIEEDIPDLVLLDLKMPKMDGIQLLEKIRGHEKYKDIPVLILTNYDDIEQISRSVQLGIKGYLVKADWDIDDVVQKVKAVMADSEE
jgi:DNA-binding response OmpR family regulator